jgi:hypothetical protein
MATLTTAMMVTVMINTVPAMAMVIVMATAMALTVTKVVTELSPAISAISTAARRGLSGTAMGESGARVSIATSIAMKERVIMRALSLC